MEPPHAIKNLQCWYKAGTVYPYWSYCQEQNIASIAIIKTIWNFGKTNQSIEIENVILYKQFAEIEIWTVDFGEFKK